MFARACSDPYAGHETHDRTLHSFGCRFTRRMRGTATAISSRLLLSRARERELLQRSSSLSPCGRAARRLSDALSPFPWSSRATNVVASAGRDFDRSKRALSDRRQCSHRASADSSAGSWRRQLGKRAAKAGSEEQQEPREPLSRAERRHRRRLPPFCCGPLRS